MSNTPERERVGVPEGVTQRPETAEIPEHIENLGVRTTQSQMPIQVQVNNQGQPVVQPSDQAVTITLPHDQNQLAVSSKGDTTDSSTWNAAYWIRRLKMAILHGWKILIGGGK